MIMTSNVWGGGGGTSGGGIIIGLWALNAARREKQNIIYNTLYRSVL